jgi:hypothetical protein
MLDPVGEAEQARRRNRMLDRINVVLALLALVVWCLAFQR